MDLIELIKLVGYLGLFIIVFAESGLFFGFFLPGDSLLFTAGFLASHGYLDLWYVAIIIFVAAVTGDSVGYAFGRKIGAAIFKKSNTIYFNQSHLIKAENYYKKNGPKTIIIARFIPIVRTFAPIVAGVGKMNYPTFIKYNVMGGFIWSFGLTFMGYYLGTVIPDADKYLMPIILSIVLLSFAPSLKNLAKK